MDTGTGSKAHSYLTLDGNDENALVGRVSTQLSQAKEAWTLRQEAHHIATWDLVALMKKPSSVVSPQNAHKQRKHLTFLPGT